MRLRIQRLSCEPPVFDPIEFTDGVNLILGERVEDQEQGRKTNGVGKSLCIEFLHFALLRDYERTRVSRIPEAILPKDFRVVLDLSVNNHEVTIIRSLAAHRRPTMIVDGIRTEFDRLEDAVIYLETLLFEGHPLAGTTTLRQLIALLMRQEESGFQDILQPFPAKKNIPPELRPHFFLMGIDAAALEELEKVIAELDRQKRLLADIRKQLLDGGANKIEDIPMLLNAEGEASRRIEKALKVLQADPAFEAVEKDLVEIERELKAVRANRKELSYRINQIEAIPLPEQISHDDLRLVYERIREGLGDLVQKSFDQAKDFQQTIEGFQRRLQREEMNRLIAERSRLQITIDSLSRRHGELTSQVDRDGALKELEVGLEVASKRAENYYQRHERYEAYVRTDSAVTNLQGQRASALSNLQSEIQSAEEMKRSLDRTIVGLHQKIMLNSQAALQFTYAKSNTALRPVSIELRTQDDGSKSVNMSKVFIYDFALLLDPVTSFNHPGFLVHDNILEVDQDTTERCLNFLAEIQQDRATEFQYILTLNRDKISSEETRKNLELDIDEAKRASFTKQEQFLKRRYQET